MQIIFEIDVFKGANDFVRSRKALLHMMEALIQINARYLQDYGEKLPTLYGSGVIYKREPKTEIWKDIPNVLAAGWGDCEDLACWRAAELRLVGIKAMPYVKWRKKQHHALVLLPSGKVEDPSIALGMNGAKPVRQPVFVSA